MPGAPCGMYASGTRQSIEFAQDSAGIGRLDDFDRTEWSRLGVLSGPPSLETSYAWGDVPRLPWDCYCPVRLLARALVRAGYARGGAFERRCDLGDK